MSGIAAKLSKDLLRKCEIDTKPLQGIVQKGVLINVDDLPYGGITLDGTNPNELITALALNSGTSGFIFEGQKNFMTTGETIENPVDAESGIVHSINNIRIMDPSVNAQEELNKLINGNARLFAVIERNWRGTNGANAFRFFGIKFGLTLKEGSFNSNENDGVPMFSLTTPEGFREPFVAHQLLETDYATTKTAFDNKFASA